MGSIHGGGRSGSVHCGAHDGVVFQKGVDMATFVKEAAFTTVRCSEECTACILACTVRCIHVGCT